MKTLFLNPPFMERYDSAGARFQATRRSRSMWYPVWLAHACALSPEESDLLDGPAEGAGIDEVLKRAAGYECVVFNTSTPSFSNDASIASLIKKRKPGVLIVFTGPHVSALPEESLKVASAVDAVTVGEFDYTVRDIISARPLGDIAGIVRRDNGRFVFNPARPLVEDLDDLPFVSPIYKKYLPLRAYYLPFTLFPYVAVYSGRGCPYQCTFCLWPQTFTGRRYRKRSISNIIEEVRYIKKEIPQAREIFFDDDTFTVNKDWVADFCDAIGPLKVRWSINARADIPLAVLKRLKRAGCRLLVVGYESGSQEILDNVKKGISLQQMIDFTGDCSRAGLMLHGTFIMGLPGETSRTMRETIAFAKRLRLDVVQCSIISPLPGTELYDDMIRKGYLNQKEMITDDGFQLCPINYPNLSNEDIEKGAKRFHREFYIRPTYFLRLINHVLKGPTEAYRVFSVGWEYVRFVLNHGHF